MIKFSPVLIPILLLGCANWQQTPIQITLPDPMKTSVECNAQLDALTAGKKGPSLIRERVPNPCDALKYAVALAKVGIVWDLYKAGALAQWGTDLKDRLRAGQMTYADLNLLLSKQILKFNQQLGGTYLLLSELTLKFPDVALISESDLEILYAGIDVIVADARRLATLPV